MDENVMVRPSPAQSQEECQRHARGAVAIAVVVAGVAIRAPPGATAT